MTTQDIDPAILASIREGAEQVIVDTDEGWRLGVRGQGLFAMGSCLGRLTITEDDRVYHSMLGSRPTFTRQEALDEVGKLEERVREILQTLDRMPT